MTMYPVDRRKLATHMYQILHSMRKVALLLKVSPATVCRWVKHPDRKPYKRCYATKSEQIVATLRGCIAANPLSTLSQITSTVQQVHKVSVSKELVRSVLLRAGYSRKRARFYGRPKDLLSKTAAFLNARDQFAKEGRVFASVDETSFGRNGGVAMGYCPRGEPLRLERKPARTTTRSVLAGACSNGTFVSVQRQGSYNTATFAEFVAGLPLPEGTVLLLDNVAFHHARGVKAAAASKGYTLLYVPPYSPWYNPIETVFSVIKRHYYQHHDVQAALAVVRESHIKGAFRHSFGIRAGDT